MDDRCWFCSVVVAAALSLVSIEAFAQDCATPVIGGYGEIFGAVTSEHTPDGMVPLRGFDNRVNTATVSNVALSGQFRCGDRARGWGQVGLDATIQFAGTTAPTYYGAEAGDWRFVQQLLASWRRDTNADRGRYWLFEVGVFLSPIGPESMAVKDNWNWSRSNLFFGLPFYHTGLQMTRGFTQRWRVSAMVFNGWNSVMDNNDEKSFHFRAVYEVADRVAWTGQVMTGVERPGGAAEGRAWRSMFDTFVTWHASNWLSLQLHANVGVEPNNLGTAWWAAGAAYARVRPWPVRLSGLSFAARWDAFYERTPESGTSIFWPISPGRPGTLMSSGTLTARLEVLGHAAVYVEGRGDYSDSALWVRSQTATETIRTPWRWTGTLGLTAWF